jgi:hypothetical protein
MSCRTWMSIRIIDPADPKAPYLSQCVEVLRSVKRDMCALRRVVLEQTPIPVRDLEVQVALFPESRITADPLTGEPICPSNTEYDAAHGFPIASPDTPAVGGRGFYHPGDETVEVTLGCTNLDAINGCGGGGTIGISGRVNDFFSGVGVTDEISVSIGEPLVADPLWVLPPTRLTALTRMGQLWTTQLEAPFLSHACLAVLDDAPQSTTSVVCRAADEKDTDLSWPTAAESTETDPRKRVGFGVRLSKAALDQILSALALSEFPSSGITIGLVLDRDGIALANQTVTPSAGTVLYLNDTLTMADGTRTSSRGVWVSLDAEFGTSFSATSITGAPVTRIGGQIEGKVTIVVLQFGQGTGG